ncbi:MAG: CatB-related O-acetyltransferase [Maritimibacter sp.]
MSPKNSIFSETELSKLYALGDKASLEAGNIRGPASQWTIKGHVSCGKFSSINGTFTARGRVRIGNYCAFGQYISVLSANHRTDMPNQQVWLNARFGFSLPIETKGPVEIGHNVWIGDKANVLSGVQIGHGSVVAAGATVSKSVEPFTIVAGTPARVVKRRFTQNVIDQLLEIAWWNWSDEKISKNKAFFEAAIPSDEDVDLISLCV